MSIDNGILTQTMLKQVYNELADVIAIFDLNLNFVYITPSCIKILGYEPNELIGQNVKKVLSRDSYDEILDLFKKEMEKENDPNSDPKRTVIKLLQEKTKEGELIWVEFSASALRNNKGEIEYILTVFRDVSQRINLEKSLKESEEKLRAIFDSTNDAIFIHDGETGKIIDVNHTMLKMYGYKHKDQVINRTTSVFSHGDYSEELALSYIKKAAMGEPQVFEWMAKRLDETRFWVEVSLTSTFIRNKKIVIAVVRDISKRKRLEQELKEQMDLFKTLSDVTSTGIGIYNEKGFIYVNRACEEITEYSMEEFTGKPFYEFAHPEFRELIASRGMERLKGDKEVPVRYEIKIITKSGIEKWVDFTAGRITYKGRPAAVGTVFDITHLKQVQKELIQEKEKFSIILGSVQDGIITTGLDGIVNYINRAGRIILELEEEEILGRDVQEIFVFKESDSEKKIKNPVIRCVREGKTFEGYDVVLLCNINNKQIDVEFRTSPLIDHRGSVLGCVLVIRDIREKKMFLEACQNAQKLQALGTLAAGIAHDFNKLLSGIYGFMDLATMKAKNSEVKKYLKKSLESLDRARHLTSQLLTFARGGEPVKEIDYLDKFLEETILFALSGSKVRPNFYLDRDIKSNFDKHQLARAIENMVLNAIEAMPDGGDIYVNLNRIYLSEEKGTLPPGEYAEISIRDKGCGISKEVIKHIFDPFFTTKSRGQGLGLATTYSIIKKHKGEIFVESEVDRGTCFYIYLPVVQDIGIKRQESNDNIITPLVNKGTIVVMDDEKLIVDLLKEVLEQYGFNVIIWSNGEELIEYLTGLDDNLLCDIKAVFFDLTIVGGMGGLETSRYVRKFLKNTPFIVMSGYSSDPVMSNLGDYGFVTSIKKPFKIEELVGVLREYV